MHAIRPPVRKLIKRGERFEKSFDGETRFAATLTFSVASSNANIAITTATGFPRRARTWTGSQIACPKIIAVAEVTATPMKEYSVMVVGKPNTWPRTCERWLRA